MKAYELTDEDIGRTFRVPGGPSGVSRVVFEGFSRPPRLIAGIRPYWLILKCSPTAGTLTFSDLSGRRFSAILIRADAEIEPVSFTLSVSAEGEIVESDDTVIP